MKKILVFICAIFSLFGLLEVSATQIYWTDDGTGKIQRANLYESYIEDIIEMGISLRGIALDISSGKMYWSEGDGGIIYRADSDGTDIEIILSGLQNPNGIALDTINSKIYWTDLGTMKIQRSNLDGSFVEDIVTKGLGGPWGIALDLVGNKMYWTDLVTGKIQRANLDGTDVEDLVLTGNTNQFGIALDVNDGKIYWINNYNKIQRSNMDGTQVEDFLETNSAIGIALDVNNEMIYWTEFGDEGKVIRANTDSTNIQPIVTGLSLPVFLALDSTSVPEPITIDIHPDTLNKKSKGKYVTSYIELPETYSVEDIDIETVMLSVGGFSISAELSPTEIGDYNDNDIPDFMVKFNRHSVQDTFEVGVVEMTLTCQNYDGVSFEGSDTVLAIDEGKKH